ncbi:MAG TPA: hypothetical protein DCX34_18480 [Roseovarius sp.]|nr:hypothetical protein [Roseovarius sp.]
MTSPELTTDTMAAVWTAIVEAGNRGIKSPEIMEITGVAESTLQHMLARWERAGYLEKKGDKSRNRVFRAAGGRSRPPCGPKEYRLWQAARGLRSFSATDLAAHASVEDGPVTPEDARAYCRMLLSVGYLRVRQKARAGERPARYTLIRDTGPKAPLKRRVTVFIDPNTNERILPEGLA